MVGVLCQTFFVIRVHICYYMSTTFHMLYAEDCAVISHPHPDQLNKQLARTSAADNNWISTIAVADLKWITNNISQYQYYRIQYQTPIYSYKNKFGKYIIWKNYSKLYFNKFKVYYFFIKKSTNLEYSLAPIYLFICNYYFNKLMFPFTNYNFFNNNIQIYLSKFIFLHRHWFAYYSSLNRNIQNLIHS